jgi:photosystem II stability/assembly factor-like uncharacterized protein
MKKYIFLLLLITSYSHAQSGWFSLDSVTNYHLNCIYFINENTGYITSELLTYPLTYRGQLLKTTNGGNHWNVVTNMNFGLVSITFTDYNKGFCIGISPSPGSGSRFMTTNAGNTWNGTSVNPGPNAVMFINQTTGFITGYSGLILRTTNGGENWNTISSGVNYYLGDACFTDSLNGFIFGIKSDFSSIILKTTNSGLNWYTNLIYQNKFFHSIFFVNSGTGFIAGGGRENFASGIILKTTNKGNNWIIMKDSINRDLKSIFMINADTGFVVGDRQGYGLGNMVMKTKDGGNNWVTQYVPTDYSLNTVYFINSTTGFISGFAGTILKTTTSGEVLGLQPISNVVPHVFVLSQNYPNPFNPQTKIEFSVPKTSFTKLIVFDLLGREVTTLVNEELKPGTYEADWDGSNFSSGVYFYKLVAGDFTETKKMVLMK